MPDRFRRRTVHPPDHQPVPEAGSRRLRSRRGEPHGFGQHDGDAAPVERVKILLGRYEVSGHPDAMMMTTLGSCVAACMHDPVLRIGGMNHFLLPDVPETELDGIGVAARYGSVAMERLINALLSQGARRDRLEVKLFGGANVIASSANIGGLNARFAVEYVRREGLRLTGHDLGGSAARRLHYFPHSGRAMRRLLGNAALHEAVSREIDFLSDLSRAPVDGEVELFGEH